MKLLDLVQRHGARPLGPVVATAVGGGLLGAVIVAVANLAIARGTSGGALALGLAFLVALEAMFACNRWSARAIVEAFENTQHALRQEVAEALRSAPLRAIEQLGDARGQVIGDLTFISSAITRLVTVLQQGAFLACITVVIGFISGKALLIWLVTCAVIGRQLLPGLARLKALRGQQSTRAGVLHGELEAFVEGFLQLKLDPAAADEVVGEIDRANDTLHDGLMQVSDTSDRIFLTSNTTFFAIAFGISVFAPASALGLGPELGYEMIILGSLSLGPLFGLLTGLPMVTRVEASATAIVEVLERLATARPDAPGRDGSAFDTVALAQLSFSYGGDRDDGFTVGPIDLTLRRGELVFVTGGNGSGKTTLMKMLLGLYPCSGRIMWDGRAVGGARMADFRGLFTAIFGGQFLFDRLYGLDAPPERVEALLERFGIADVVGWDDEHFGHLELSSGQRMRLAMVVALLEDRPICVFDEWTANQDPQTTWMYYDTLLPELIAEGRTVIAVSHDDRFFDRADHLIELRHGRVVVERRDG